jgi:hypothetical protein
MNNKMRVTDIIVILIKGLKEQHVDIITKKNGITIA